MHYTGKAIDTWERMENALSPMPPFPPNAALQRLAGVMAPLFFVALFVKAAWVVRGAEFLLGFLFFSQPWLSAGWRWLNRNYPDWVKLLDLQ
jgi:hypothetical protein